MSVKAMKIRYNLKSDFLKKATDKKETTIKTQNTDESQAGEMNSGSGSEQYPRWPYETREDYNNSQENQPENNNPMYNNPMYNQPAYVPPIYNMPIYGQPAYNWQQPPVFIRNPYVPVGRERISRGYSQTTREHDIAIMALLYNDINRTLYPIVQEVLNEYEYDGSPIYSKEIDRETIAQLVNRVLTRAGEVSDDVQETMLDEGNEAVEEYIFEWNRRNLLNTAIESILMNEIFEVRRPNFRRIRERYNYSDGTYNGINYYYQRL